MTVFISTAWLTILSKVAAITTLNYDLVGAILNDMSDSSSVNQSVDTMPSSSDPKKADETSKSLEKSSTQKSHQSGSSNQDGGSKPSTSGVTRSRTRATSSSTSASKSTAVTTSSSAADVLTKAMAMFNDLSSTISDLSVKIHDLDSRQTEMENSRKRKQSSGDGPADKRRRLRIISDESEDEDSHSEGEVLDDSGDDFSDRIDVLFNDKSSQNKDSVHESEWLDQFAQDFINEDVRSPSVSPKLADILNGILSKKICDEKIKSKLDVYPAPQNVEGLITPKVNPEVWGKIKSETRSRDVRLQKAQIRITRGLSALAMLGEKITAAQAAKEPVDLHECLKLTLNSFALIANGNMEVSFRRREFIRPDLNSSYRELCSPATPITDLLFGDELARTVSHINETNRMAFRVSNFSQRGGHQRYGYKNKNSNNNGNFKKNSYPPKNGAHSSFKKGKRGGGASNNQNRR